MNDTGKPDNNTSSTEPQEQSRAGERHDKSIVEPPTDSEHQASAATEATIDKNASTGESPNANTPPDPGAQEPTKGDSPVAATSQSKPTQQAEPRTGATWPGKLALLLALIALGALGWLYWQGWQLQQRTATLGAQVNDEVSSELKAISGRVEEQLAGVDSTLTALQARSRSDQEQVQQLQQRLTDAIKQVSATQETSRSDWLLAETEYLLRLANQRVLMEQTPAGALSLLQAADEILHEVDDVALYEVRQAVAEDIAALEAVPTLDTEGIYLKLAAMSKQVDQLRVTPVTDKHQLPSMLEEITPDAVEETWTAGASAAWNWAMEKFEKLVVIQHRDEPVEPLLSPEQTYYLQQNLHLMLEQAQLALLQRKQKPFDTALEKALQWVETYFDDENATTQALVRGLQQLSGTEVSPEMPDISGSLRVLQSHLREMTRLKQEAGQ